MNIKRILTTVIGFPVIVAILMWVDLKIVDLLLAIVAIRSIYEYNNCAKKTCKTISWVSYIFAILIAFIHIISADVWKKILPIIIPVFLLLQFLQVIITDGKTTYKDVSYTTTGTLYIIVLITFFSLLYGSKNGKILIWYIIFSSWGSDIFAYIIGKHFGKHKFSKISPNKTIEGCIAGIIGATVLCLVYTFFVNKYFSLNLEYIQIAIASILFSIIGQIGDFSASVIKRHFQVKDFSDLFPGHGGMIDRIDSIIFIAPFAYYYFIILLG